MNSIVLTNKEEVINITSNDEQIISVETDVNSISVNVSEGVEGKLYITSINTSEVLYNINVHSNAKLEFVVLYNNDNVSSVVKSSLSDNAILNLFVLDISHNSIFDIHTDLNGEYAAFELNTGTISKTDMENSFNIRVNHNQKATESNCTSRAVVLNSSTYSNITEGFIAKGNSYSKCHQDTKAIVFNEEATAKCDPILLIDEYDVEASHAAAVGQVNEEDLYYLQSRGLSYDQCIALLVNGFIIGVFDNITNEDVKETFVNTIHAELV